VKKPKMSKKVEDALREQIEELSEQLEPLFETLNNGADYEVALIGAAFLERSLEVLLMASLSGTRVGGKGVLANDAVPKFLQPRIKLARALGMVSSAQAHDLLKICEARNHFAHHFQRASFRDTRVASAMEAVRAMNWLRASTQGAGSLSESSTERSGTSLEPTEVRARFCYVCARASQRLLLSSLGAKPIEPRDDREWIPSDSPRFSASSNTSDRLADVERPMT